MKRSAERPRDQRARWERAKPYRAEEKERWLCATCAARSLSQSHSHHYEVPPQPPGDDLSLGSCATCGHPVSGSVASWPLRRSNPTLQSASHVSLWTARHWAKRISGLAQGSGAASHVTFRERRKAPRGRSKCSVKVIGILRTNEHDTTVVGAKAVSEKRLSILENIRGDFRSPALLRSETHESTAGIRPRSHGNGRGEPVQSIGRIKRGFSRHVWFSLKTGGLRGIRWTGGVLARCKLPVNCRPRV